MSIRALALGVLLVAAVIVGAAIYAVIHDWKAEIESAVESATGRKFEIARLSVSWTWPPIVRASDVRLANAPWGSRPNMITIDRLEMQIDLWELLSGSLRYHRLHLNNPIVLLERNQDGVGNWKFEEMSGGGLLPFQVIPKSRDQFPTLLSFQLANGKLIYRDPPDDVEIIIGAKRLSAKTPGSEQSVQIKGEGSYDGAPMMLEGEFGSFSVLQNPGRPYPTRFRLWDDKSAFTFDGTMMKPLDIVDVRGSATLEGEDVRAAARIFNLDVPATPGYRIAGQLDKGRLRWELRESAGSIGDSAFTGSVTFVESDRKRIRDDLAVFAVFGSLDLAQLLGDPNWGNGGKSDGGGLVPAIPVKIKGTQDLTVRLNLQADEVRYGFPLGGLKILAQISHERIEIENLEVQVAGGSVSGSGTARQLDSGARIEVRGALGKIDLGKALAMMGLSTPMIKGQFAGNIDLAATGKTLPALVKAMDGKVSFFMDKGSVQRSLVEKASLDLVTLLLPGQDTEQSKIACFVGDMVVNDGKANVPALVLRTPDTTVVGKGEIFIGKQEIDLVIEARSPGIDLLKLEQPIHVSGSFNDVSFSPFATSLVDEADGTLLGVVAAPLKELLPRIESQLGSSSGCLDLIRQSSEEQTSSGKDADGQDSHPSQGRGKH